MSQAECDAAELLLLRFQETQALDLALAALRELRRRACVQIEAVVQLAWRGDGDTTITLDTEDAHCLAGALLAMLTDILVGKATIDPLRFSVSTPLDVSGVSPSVKVIDRGISSERLKRLHSILVPGSWALVALVRKSAAAALGEALVASRALNGAKRHWLDLETDLDLLITDVLGAHVAVSAALLSAGEPTTSETQGAWIERVFCNGCRDVTANAHWYEHDLSERPHRR